MELVRKHGPWALLAAIGAGSLGVLATSRGEHVNALWILTAAICVYLVAYRYYSLYIAQRVMRLDPARAGCVQSTSANNVPLPGCADTSRTRWRLPDSTLPAQRATTAGSCSCTVCASRPMPSKISPT